MEALLDLRIDRPDKHTDRAAWNASWERDLAQVYADASPARPGFPAPLKLSPETLRRVALYEQQTLAGLESEIRLICTLQQDISRYALAKLACDGLEGTWRAMPREPREKLILEAIYRTSCTGRDMEEFRRWCPEITVARIAEDDGRLFMDLLTAIIGADPAKPRVEPVTFPPNLLVNRLLADLSIPAHVRRYLLINRCYFLSFVVWRILLALYNDDEGVVAEDIPFQSMGLTPPKYTIATPEGNETLERLGTDLSDVDTCHGCGTHASLLLPGSALKACTKCKEIGRIIRYCSTKCQTEDWKKGTPHPHKKICGKVFVEDAERIKRNAEQRRARAAAPAALIPDADPGFKRSISLQYQISQLKQYPQFDYMITQAGDRPDVSVTVPEELGDMRVMFLIMRRRAMRNGDAAAVNAMFAIMRPFSDQIFPSAYVAAQLHREYGVVVNMNQGTIAGESVPEYSEDEEQLVLDYLRSQHCDR